MVSSTLPLQNSTDDQRWADGRTLTNDFPSDLPLIDVPEPWSDNYDLSMTGSETGPYDETNQGAMVVTGRLEESETNNDRGSDENVRQSSKDLSVTNRESQHVVTTHKLSQQAQKHLQQPGTSILRSTFSPNGTHEIPSTSEATLDGPGQDTPDAQIPPPHRSGKFNGPASLENTEPNQKSSIDVAGHTSKLGFHGRANNAAVNAEVDHECRDTEVNDLPPHQSKDSEITHDHPRTLSQCLRSSQTRHSDETSDVFSSQEPSVSPEMSDQDDFDVVPIGLRQMMNKQPRRQASKRVTREHRRSSLQVTANAPPDELTESDLLGMLMYRARQKERQSYHVLEEHQALIVEKAKLQEANCELRSQIFNATTSLTEAENVRNTACNQLHIFTKKYQKLKAWAVEMNIEYGSLNQQSHNVNVTLSDIAKDKADIQISITDLAEAQHQSSQALADMKKNLQASKNEILQLTKSLEQKDLKLQSNLSDLKNERCERKKLELHVSHLVGRQAAFDKSSEYRDQSMRELLVKIGDRLNSIEQVSSDSTIIDHCLKNLEVLLEKQVATSEDVSNSSTAMKFLLRELDEAHRSSVTSLKEAIDNKLSSLDSESLNLITQAISELKPDLSLLKELREDRARYAARAQHHKLLCKVLGTQKDLEVAKLAGLQKTNEELVLALSRMKQSDSKADDRVASSLQDQISELNLRWRSAQTMCKDSEDKLEASEEMVKQMTESINLVRKQHEEELLRVQTEERMHASKSIDEFDSRLDQEKQQHGEIKQQVEQQAHILNDLKMQLSVARQEETHANDRLLSCKRDLENTNLELQAARISVNKIPYLETRLADLEREGSDLIARLQTYENVEHQLADLKGDYTQLQHELDDEKARHDGIKQRLESSQNECEEVKQQCSLQAEHHANLKIEMKDLTESLQAAQNMVNMAKQQDHDLKDLQENYDKICGQLAIAQHDGKDVIQLRQRVEEMDTELIEAHKRAESVQGQTKQIANLTEEITTLTEQVSHLTQDLEVARGQSMKIIDLENNLRQKVETLNEFQRKVAELTVVTSELQNIRDESQRKDVELASLQDRIVRLEEESQQLEQIREHIPDEMMGAFLSQNSVLSIKSLILPDSQAENFDVVNDCGEEDDLFADDELERPERRAADRSGAVDPRLLMLQPAKSGVNSGPLSSALSQQSVVQDSQSETDSHTSEENLSPKESSRSNSKSTKPHGFIGDDNGIQDAHNDADDIFDLPQSPQIPDARDMVLSVRSSSHARSVASQESMLLHATPGNRARYTGAASKQIRPIDVHHPDTEDIGSRVKLADPSPRRLRSESQGRRSTPFPDTQPTNTVSRPQPNSAMKRRLDTPSEADIDAKRLRRTPANLQICTNHRYNTNLTDVTQTQATFSPSRDLPSSSRSGTVDDTKTAGTNKSARKSRQPNRRSSKNDRYTARFAPGTTNT